MKIHYVVFMLTMASLGVEAADKNTADGGRVLPQSEALMAMSREATSVVAGQMLRAPDGCIHGVKFLNGALSLTPVHDENGQPVCASEPRGTAPGTTNMQPKK